MRAILTFISITALSCFSIIRADPFVDAVVDVSYGTYAGFGQDQFPDIVLGPPHGSGAAAGSTDVLSLGDGGNITLEFTDNIVRNGPGPDLIVFENPFYVSGNPENVLAEVAFVEVSQDGETFFRFPNDYDPEGTPQNNPQNWRGFAGVYPVYSSPDNGIDPTDPETAGGDAFDLDDVGLDWIRFIRIIDTDEPPNAAQDDDGDEIYDPGWVSEGSSGFDLDAVAAVHSEDIPTPSPSATAHHTATPTPTTPPDPTDTPTPAESTTPTPTASSTPVPNTFILDLILSQHSFHPGDTFRLDAELWNPEPAPTAPFLVIALEVQGNFYFWPSWNPDVDFRPITLYPGSNQQGILDFIWPDISETETGLKFWGVLFDEGGVLLSDIEMEPFDYGP